MNIQKIIWGLEELSDKSLQETLWSGKSKGEMSSFVEAVCSTFDDSGLSSLLDSPESHSKILPETLYKAKTLRELVRRIPGDIDPARVVDHPIMDDIRRLSSEILKSLTPNESELR